MAGPGDRAGRVFGSGGGFLGSSWPEFWDFKDWEFDYQTDLKTKGNKRSAGFTVEERKSFETNFLSKGFVDTFREQHPGVVGYTYWGYRHNGRKNNKGWRLDYFLVSQSITNNVHDSYILSDITGSDHSPIGLVLKI